MVSGFVDRQVVTVRGEVNRVDVYLGTCLGTLGRYRRATSSVIMRKCTK